MRHGLLIARVRADPFVELHVKGAKYSQSQKSAVVNKSLNPSWNQQFSL